MSAFRLMFAEIGFRSLSFVLCVLAVVVATALLVAGPTLVSGHASETDEVLAEQEKKSRQTLEERRDQQQASLKEFEAKSQADLAALEKTTKRATRDLGFNLNIVHKDTTMGSLYVEYKLVTMPEEYISKLANAEEIDMIRHLLASLQDIIKYNGRSVMLVGFLPEAHQSHMSEKPPMQNVPEPGSVYVGFELWGDLEPGDTIEVEGPGGKLPLKVANETEPEEMGSQRDASLIVHLHDAQKILGKPGEISQIMALGCHCSEANLPNIREKLSKVLPDTRITEHKTRRISRAIQRDAAVAAKAADLQRHKAEQQREYEKAERHEQKILADLKADRENVQRNLEMLVAALTPLVVIACAAFIGLMSWNNVRERRTEIGILRALGKGRSTVAALFLGKAIVLGVTGGCIGVLLGLGLAKALGVTMGGATEFFSPAAWIIVVTMIGAPLVAALASYPPTLSAMRQDPAIVLQDG
jgi:putative ABC transport system permease protein